MYTNYRKMKKCCLKQVIKALKNMNYNKNIKNP